MSTPRAVRRVGAAIVACLIFGALAVGPVAANQPNKFTYTNDSFELAAGEVCDFPILIEATREKTKVIILDRKDGVFQENSSGQLFIRVTNLATGASVTRNSSSGVQLSFTSDGRLVYKMGGPSLFWFFDGDVTGRGLVWWQGGNVIIEFDADRYYIVRAELPGQMEDVCATLS